MPSIRYDVLGASGLLLLGFLMCGCSITNGGAGGSSGSYRVANAPPPHVEPATNRSQCIEGRAAPSSAVSLVRNSRGYAKEADNVYVLSIPGFQQHYATQITPEVCWAASVQMVLGAKGVGVTQEEILELFRERPNLFGSKDNDFGNLADICNALEAAPRTGLRRRQSILAFFETRTMHEVAADLAEGYPPIACLSQEGGVGHVYVVTGMKVSFVRRKMLSARTFAFWQQPHVYDPETTPRKQGKKEQQEAAGLRLQAGGPDSVKYRDFMFRKDDPFVTTDVLVHEVHLADPDPQSQGEVVLSGQEFKEQVRYIVRFRIVRN